MVRSTDIASKIESGAFEEDLDSGVFHSFDAIPIDWYDEDSTICCACGVAQKYKETYRCIPCTTAREPTQFKYCLNHDDETKPRCEKYVLIGRRGKDLCVACSKTKHVPILVLCSVCQAVKTRPTDEGDQKCAICRRRSEVIPVMQCINCPAKLRPRNGEVRDLCSRCVIKARSDACLKKRVRRPKNNDTLNTDVPSSSNCDEAVQATEHL